MSPISKAFAGFAVAAVLSSTAGAQGVVTQKNISMALAQTIANAALAQCESMGFKVSVTVVDRAGLALVMLRGDGAGLNTPEGRDRKAFTARSFSQPSADFVKRLADRPDTVGSRQYTRVLALAGGAPIQAGNAAGRRAADQGRQRCGGCSRRLRFARQGRRLRAGQHRQGGRSAQVKGSTVSYRRAPPAGFRAPAIVLPLRPSCAGFRRDRW